MSFELFPLIPLKTKTADHNNKSNMEIDEID